MIKWFDVKKEFPPVEEKVLALVNGEIVTAVYEDGTIWNTQGKYDTDGEAYALGLVLEDDEIPDPWQIYEGWYEVDHYKRIYFIDPELDGKVTYWMYISDLYFN